MNKINVLLSLWLLYLISNLSSIHALIGFKKHIFHGECNEYIAIPVPRDSVYASYQAQCDFPCAFFFLTDKQFEHFKKTHDHEYPDEFIHKQEELRMNSKVSFEIENNGTPFNSRYNGPIHLVVKNLGPATNVTGMLWYGIDVETYWVPVTYIVLIILVVALTIVSSVLGLLYIIERSKNMDETKPLLDHLEKARIQSFA